MRTLVAWARLGRPRFLAAGVLLYALGALLARPVAQWDLAMYLWGQGFVTATQAMVHYHNDLHDLAGDSRNRHRTAWSGGSGVLVQGHVPRSVAGWTAGILGAAAVGVAVAAAFRTDLAPGTLGLLALTLLLAYGYSAPRPRLQARGWGPLVTTAVVAGLVPLIAYRFQDAPVGPDLLALLPPALFLAALLLLLDLPDKEADAAAGKRTPTVRWGRRATGRLALAAVLLGYALVPVLLLWGAGWTLGAAVAASLPWGLWSAGSLARGAAAEPAAWEPLQTMGLGLFLGTVVALAALRGLSPLLP